MKYYVEISLKDFAAWSGGADTKEELTDDELDTLECMLEEIEPEEGYTDTAINDILWFERDTIAEWLGYEDWDDLERKHRGEEDEEDE